MLTDAELQALWLSLKVSVRAVAFALPVAVACAWLLARRRFFGKTIFDGVVHLPLVVPPVVVGYLLLILFGVKGVIGQPLYDWFGIRLVFTSAGASLAIAVTTFPLMVRAIRLSIEAIDTGLEDAARTLGARPIDRFFTITLPLMLPGILAGGVLAFSAGLGEFGAVITFVSNIPGETQTLPLAIYSATQTPGGEGAAARLAALSIALALGGLMLSEFLGRRVRRMLGS